MNKSFKSISDQYQIDTCGKIINEIDDKLKEVNKLMGVYTRCKLNIMNYDGELDSKELKCLVEVMTLQTKF